MRLSRSTLQSGIQTPEDATVPFPHSGRLHTVVVVLSFACVSVEMAACICDIVDVMGVSVF